MSDDGNDRLMIHLRVVKPVEQMNRARPGSGDAHPNFAGEFRMRTRHEGAHFFMARLNKANFIACFPQTGHHPVDPVAGVSIDTTDSPLDEALDETPAIVKSMIGQ